MHAISFAQFGGPEVLTLTEVAVPEPGPGQVRVAVRTAAVNGLDWKIRRGLLAPALPHSLPAVPGYDVAGIVDAVGPDVEAFAVGDEVLGASVTGSYAEYALAAADGIVPKPAGVDWAVAGGFDSVARTALRVLAELDVRPGATLLVHGASGSVGQLLVQLALGRGVTVIGTASARNQDQLIALGATAIVYGDGFTDRARSAAGPAGVDRAADLAGKGDLGALVELTGDPAHVVTISDPAAADNGVRFSAGMGFLDPNRSELVAQLADGRLVLAVDGTYPLAEAAAAQQRSEAGHASGRLVLVVSQ
jgi:NADPH:quinone reductase-like Zn-dependent oxidoreductase